MLSWRNESPVRTVRTFINATNAHDFSTVEKLLADNFRMIDMCGAELIGMQPCIAFMCRFAAVVPDYRIRVSDLVQRGEDILISGQSTSDHPDVDLAVQWRAQARAGKLQELQSYGRKRAPSMMMQFMSSCPAV